MGELDGRVALVAGASRGIGEAIAELFALESAKVVCAASTLREGDHQLGGSLERTVRRIQEAGGEAAAVTADVPQETDCIRLAAAAEEAFGPVDVLVNNAALNYYISIVDYPASRWMRAFAVNVHGPFMLPRAVLPGMIAKRRGAITNISSGSAIGPGRGPYPESKVTGSTMYGAGKAALERFPQGLAQEVYAHGVAVSCFSPSQAVPTPGTVFHKLVDGMDDPRGKRPEMMAKAAFLCATEPLDAITGRVTYSQQILREFGWIAEGRGRGIEIQGTGYSQI